MLTQNDKLYSRDEIIQQIHNAGNKTKVPVKAIILLLPNGKIEKINPSAKKILKNFFLQALKLGDSIFPLIPTSQLQFFGEQLQKVLSTGIAVSELFYIGEKSKFYLSLIPVFDQKGYAQKINLLFSPVVNVTSENQGKIFKNTKILSVGSNAPERISLEHRIIQERSMFKTILNNIPDAIFAVNNDHQTILTNKKFYFNYLGKSSEEETLGLQPVDYFPFKEGEEIMEDNKKVMESGIPVINRKETVFDHKGNKEVILLTKVPFQSEDKTNTGLLGIGRNITASYNFEEEQKFIHRLIRALGTKSTHKRALKQTIEMMAEFFGFSVAEAWEVGFDKKNIRKVADFGTSNNDELLKNNSIEVLKKNKGLPGITWKNKKIQIWTDLQNEKRFQRSDLIKGSEIFIGVGVPVILKKEVIAVLVFFVAKDQIQPDLKRVLERVAIQLATEIKRKMIENQLNNMFDFSPNLIAVIGLDGYLKKVNPAFFKIFGFSEVELLETPFTEFLHPDEKSKTYERLKEVAGGSTPRPFENRCISKSGEWRWISWTPSELIEEEGIVHLFGNDITPIKTLNLELLQYRNLIESSKDGVAFISLNPERVFLNSSFRNIIGLSDEKEISRSELEGFYSSRKTVRNIFSTLMAGKYYEGDINLKSSKGEILNFNLRGGPVFNDKAELIAVFGLHTDISERKKYESSLKAYGNRINNILESITDGFFSLNENWEVTYWNKEAENLVKLKKEDILNKNIRHHFPQTTNLIFYTKFQEARGKNIKISFEEYFEPLKKWFDLSVYPGKEGLSVYFRDVTDKKKNNEQIRIAKERYDLVAKATREAVYDWNIVDNHFEWSDVYYDIYGYGKMGKHETLEQWEKNVHPEDKEEVLEHLFQCLNSSKVKWEYEYRLIKKNRQIASVLERGFIIRDKDGKALRMIGALQDITEIKQNEIALEELNYKLEKHAGDLAVSNAELEQFAYIASHDLQEPLRMVTSFLTLLQRKYNDQLDDKARQYIYFATDGAVRMRQIILDLLEYSRVGKLDYSFEKIDLNVMLEEISLLHSNLIRERSAVIKYNNLPVIHAAVTPLQRVLSNLISNSIKYNLHEPDVKIRVIEKQKYWQFDIEDNGIGINEQFQEKIFVIFQRLHSREQYSGTGLGLAICKKIVENHGGKIWVTSKEGEGSTFHFTILKHF